MAAAWIPVAAQPVGRVSYTEAIEHVVRRTVDLPGSVGSRTESVVASEVAGLVIELAVQPGDSVSKGEPLVRLRTAAVELQLRAKQGQLTEARARLEQADRNLKRARELFRDDVISQEQVDDALSESTAWQGRLDQTTAQIAGLELDLERCVIRAPFAGAVVIKLTDVGQWVGVGGPVMGMVALDKLEIRVDVPERYFDQLEKGTDVHVAFEALPDMEVTGRLDKIIPRADPQARSFPVRVRISDPAGRIGVGMLARVRIPVGQPYDAVVVPKDALVHQGDREFVYRINGDGTVEQVRVESVQGVGAWVAVRGPVSSGQRVVTRGNERLRPGQVVQGEPLEYPLP